MRSLQKTRACKPGIETVEVKTDTVVHTGDVPQPWAAVYIMYSENGAKNNNLVTWRLA